MRLCPCPMLGGGSWESWDAMGAGQLYTPSSHASRAGKAGLGQGRRGQGRQGKRCEGLEGRKMQRRGCLLVCMDTGGRARGRQRVHGCVRVRAKVWGLFVYCSNAYSTATQHASLPPRAPCARRLCRVGKKASHAGHGCMLSSAEEMLLLCVEEADEPRERERLEEWET